ncbi:phospholipid-binding lipoprotein MlaA [Desulfocicer vacuolatum DSM 3385]|uniref:Phospholipid-binding lipoprotein MlaA n=2 Tax=Desulfocicer vacuolatum TaxID=2298 RepID=A0A1W1ZNV4_9BACT|nr:phospholipid-binding lipoprotein MlaA [Desulfocicer vacuolatum DSM 3385]
MERQQKMLCCTGVGIVVSLLVLICSLPAMADERQLSYSEADDLFAEYEADDRQPAVPDPLYWFNYSMYHFNDKLYFWGLKPLAQGYKIVAPPVLRRGIHNFFYNALFPVRFVNNLLQGKITSTGNEFSIFMINTMGSLGFARIAQDEHGFKDSREDLGQTLGSYGVGQGFYLVLPFLGPCTLRDVAGKAGDYFLNPTGYIDSTEVRMGVTALDVVNGTSLRIGDYEALKEASFDPYIALKDAYVQLRQNQVEQ